jgi:heat shock protein HtpX
MDLVGHDEAEGVIAHELGHIRNRDMLLQTLSATMAGAITNLARFGAYAPSEGRRGSPLALASALAKLQAAAQRVPMAVSPTMAPLAQVNPLSAFRGGIASLFATHPPTEERIARLQAIARGET